MIAATWADVAFIAAIFGGLALFVGVIMYLGMRD